MDSVCVLIPTKNRKKLLERALQSLVNQKILPDEVIVINDGSTDGTDLFLKKYNNKNLNLIYINKEKSGGVNVARHDGIRLSNAKWIATLDDDDEFFPDAILKIKQKIPEIKNNVSVLFFNTFITKNKESFLGGFKFRNGEEKVDIGYEDMMFIRSRINGDCKPVIKRDIFSIDGYKFPETVNGSESYLFYLLARDGKGIRFYPEITTHIHQEEEVGDRLSISASKKNPWPLFVLHLRQIPQHLSFYIKHPLFFYEKIKTMIKLFIRSIFVLFGVRF